MSCKERLMEMFRDSGIAFEMKDDKIICRESTENVHGFGGFYVEFLFDEAGKFVEVGIWE